MVNKKEKKTIFERKKKIDSYYYEIVSVSSWVEHTYMVLPLGSKPLLNGSNLPLGLGLGTNLTHLGLL